MTWLSTRPRKVPPNPICEKKRRKAMPEHDVRNHQRRHEKRGHGLAARETVADDAERRRHRKADGDRRGERRQPDAVAKRADELGIVEDGPEPAQAQAPRRQRKKAFRREGYRADDQDRRQDEADEERVEGKREWPVAAHSNTCA